MSQPSAPLSGLRRLSRPRPPAAETPAPREVCEMCSADIGAEHGHVADLQAQRLLCTCRSCYLLFTGGGAGGGRFRALPERSRRVVDVAISQGQWDALQIPVDLAFLFHRDGSAEFSACYPGPGGATESMLDLSSWDEVLAANPVLAGVQPDVEAVLLRRQGGSFECYLTPIDTCYALVGLVRRDWVGFHGGQEVWDRIGAFFDDLHRRSVPVATDGQGASDA